MFSVAGIFGWIATKLGSGFVQALLGNIVTIYSKSKDTKLAGLQALTTSETQQNIAYLQAHTETNKIRASADKSIVAQTIIATFCIPFALHTALIALDSTFMLGCNHYGCLGVPALPKPYDVYEWDALKSFLLLSPALPIASATARLIASKI